MMLCVCIVFIVVFLMCCVCFFCSRVFDVVFDVLIVVIF